MTKEEAQVFENGMMDRIANMTAHVDDDPVYQLTGEIIPLEERKSGDSSSKG